MLKSDRDDVITNFKNESDEDLKDFYKSEFRILTSLYKEKMEEYYSGGNGERNRPLAD